MHMGSKRLIVMVGIGECMTACIQKAPGLGVPGFQCNQTLHVRNTYDLQADPCRPLPALRNCRFSPPLSLLSRLARTEVRLRRMEMPPLDCALAIMRRVLRLGGASPGLVCRPPCRG